MNVKWIAACVGVVGLAAGLALTGTNQLKVSDIEWESFMGKKGADDRKVYVLMGQGFMGLPGLGGPNFPEELDVEIAGWMKSHPQATVVPVNKLPLSEDFSFVYVWLLDGEVNLNLLLVRKGLCNAQNMLIGGGELLVDQAKYDQFRQEAMKAEQLAIQDKAGIWAKPGMKGEARWKNAEFLEEQGDLEGAIMEFQAAVESEHEGSSAWYRIGRIYEKLGRVDEALEAYDRSIAAARHENESRWAQIEKARLLASQGKADAAIDVYGDLKTRCTEDLTPCMDAAVALVPTSPAKAVEILEPPLLAFLSSNEIVFEGDTLKFDAQRAKRSDRYWMALHEAGSAFTSLASFCLAAGETDKALQNAARGISIKQNTRGVLADKLDSLTMEAADYHARLVRARAFIAKKMFNEAKRELDFAKVLIDTGQIQGGFVHQEMDHAYQELRNAFPDREVNVPPKHVPASKAKPKQFTSEELGGMKEDQLVTLAAGADNAASFAALEELVSRHRSGELSEQTLKQLIADGLEHRSNLKAEPLSRRTQASAWRAQYGVFIEEAMQKGELSQENRARYLSKMVGIAIDWHGQEVEGSPPLHLALDVEPRLGGALKDRDALKAKWTSTIRIEGAKIDDKAAKIILRGSDDNTETEGLMGGISGMICEVVDFERLAPGAHMITVHGQVEIREGDLGLRTEPEDLAKIDPVIRYAFLASAEFEVAK